MKNEANYKTNSLVGRPKPRVSPLCSLLGWVVKIVRRPRLKIIARVFKQIALVDPDNVVPGKAQSHLLVKSVYTT